MIRHSDDMHHNMAKVREEAKKTLSKMNMSQLLYRRIVKQHF